MQYVCLQNWSPGAENGNAIPHCQMEFQFGRRISGFHVMRGVVRQIDLGRVMLHVFLYACFDHMHFFLLLHTDLYERIMYESAVVLRHA